MPFSDVFPSSSVDHLIERQLPGWLSDADVLHLRGYQQALRAQQDCAERLQQILKRIPSLEAYAGPLLEKALLEAGFGGIDPQHAHVVISEQFTLPSAAQKLYAPRITHQSRQSLLAAALHNFQDQETQPFFLRKAHLEGPRGERLALRFERFAVLCRKLDIGGRYQALLKAVLQPSKGRGQREVLFEDNLRTRLRASLYEARMKGELDEADLRRLLPLVVDSPDQASTVGTMTPRQLFVLGKCVNGAVALELRPAPDADVDEIVLWLPGDPEKSLHFHDSWNDLYSALALRLEQPAFRVFFSRFIKASDRSSFDTRLVQLLAASVPGLAVELDGRNFPVEGAVFTHVRRLQIAKIFEDARFMAVPTGDEDRLSRHERLQGMLNAGLDLLGLASFFIPVLGEVMLLVSAEQLLGEVYHGYQDWRVGDRQGALDHLFNVAQCVVLGGAGVGAIHLLQRVPFVDLLEPMAVGEKGLKLSRNTDRAHFEQAPAFLMQGMQGGGLAGLLMDEGEMLLDITGITRDQLRRLRVEHAAPPARLIELNERIRLHAAFPELSGAAFEGKLTSLRPTPSADQALLIGAFQGLSPAAAGEIIEHSSTAQLEQLRRTGRVPLSMAERARWHLRDSRIDLACLGIRLQAALSPDSERLVLGLVERRAPWPAARSLQLREGSREGRVLFASHPEGVRSSRIIVRHADGYTLEGPGEPATTTAGQSLLAVLLQCLDEPQQRAFGRAQLTVKQLRDSLLKAARSNREEAAQWVGLAPVGAGVRPPLRFADGRLAYRLSGGGESSQQAIRRGIHQIFPTLSELQLEAYVNAVRARGENLWEHYQALQRQLAALRQSLSEWQSQWLNPVDAIRRRRVAQTLRRGWRRKLVNINDEYELVIDGEHIDHLPQLPEGLEYTHVQRLVLRDMGLQAIDADFLRRFPNLVELDLSNNRLQQVPEGLEALIHLRRLNLASNHLVLDTQANQRFTQLALLDSIELSFNPLTQAPDLSGLRHVRHVHLRSTELVDVTELLERASWRALVDLRDNRIRELEQEMHGLSLRLSRAQLHDNPLSAASRERLDQWRGHTVSGAHGSASYWHREAGSAVRDLWTDTRDKVLRLQREASWDRLRQEPGSHDLFRFLADFSYTDDFENHPGHFRRRVWRILDACEHNEVLREQLFREAGGPRSCEDRLLLMLNQLEVGVLVQQGVAGVPAAAAEQSLLRLGRQLYRLDQVDAIAARHVERMRASSVPGIDEIEVRLIYRNRLAHALDLPVHVEDMHFASFANVSEAELAEAQAKVLQGETTEAVLQTLVHRPFWSNYARRHYAQRFETLAEPFHHRLADIEAQASNGTEQHYVQRANELMRELELAELQLLGTLAEEAWARRND